MRNRTGYLFVAPWLCGLALLTIFPFVASFYWSFCRYDLLSPPEFVGLGHYARIVREISGGEGVGRALWDTGYYAAVAVPLSVVVGIGLATVLSWDMPGRSVLRTLCYVPSVIPVVAASVLWMALLDARTGLVNQVLGWMGIPGPGWFSDYREVAWLPGWFSGNGGVGSKDALALMALWAIGNTMIIYLAALGDVPRELHEAAALDGAGRWRRFRHVTLPLISPVILFNLVMGLIQAVQMFAQVYVVSEGTGAPERSLLVLSLYLFLAAFQDLDMGYASAIAWLTFVVLASVTGLLFYSARGWVHYEGARP